MLFEDFLRLIISDFIDLKGFVNFIQKVGFCMASRAMGYLFLGLHFVSHSISLWEV